MDKKLPIVFGVGIVLGYVLSPGRAPEDCYIPKNNSCRIECNISRHSDSSFTLDGKCSHNSIGVDSLTAKTKKPNTEKGYCPPMDKTCN